MSLDYLEAHNPINIAAQSNHVHIVERLLQDSRLDPSKNNDFTLQWACLNGHTHIFDKLMQDKRVDLCKQGGRALLHACFQGHLEIVKKLLKKKKFFLPIDAIRFAARNGYVEVIKELLKYDYILHGFEEAVKMGHLEVVELFLQEGADPSTIDKKTIQIAIQKRHNKVLARLFQDPRMELWTLDEDDDN
jgi:ankyrin repeat protein